MYSKLFLFSVVVCLFGGSVVSQNYTNGTLTPLPKEMLPPPAPPASGSPPVPQAPAGTEGGPAIQNPNLQVGMEERGGASASKSQA